MNKWLVLWLLFPVGNLYAQQAIDVEHYRFELQLSDQTDAITGKAQLTIRFREDMAALQLDLVSVKDEKGMYAFMVREGQQVLPSRHVNDKILITLTRPAKKGELRSFEIQYMGTPEDGLII